MKNEQHVSSFDGRISSVKVVYFFRKEYSWKGKNLSGRLYSQTIIRIYFSSIFRQTCTTVNNRGQGF